MDKIIDLHQLVNTSQYRQNVQQQIFAKIFEQCHQHIKRYATEHKTTECYYTVPLFIVGFPAYEHSLLVEYLLHHLCDNGLYAKYFNTTNQIYISWHPSLINVDKNEKRRKRLYYDDSRTNRIIAEPANHHKVSHAEALHQHRIERLKPAPPTKDFNGFMRSMF